VAAGGSLVRAAAKALLTSALRQLALALRVHVLATEPPIGPDLE
jgi:hypothetical protein